jgi:hypothetical protein
MHVRQRYMNVAHRRRTIRQIQGRCRRRKRLRPTDTPQQGFHVESGRAAARLDGSLHVVETVVRQQVQDTDIVLDGTAWTMLTFQIAA